MNMDTGDGTGGRGGRGSRGGRYPPRGGGRSSGSYYNQQPQSYNTDYYNNNGYNHGFQQDGGRGYRGRGRGYWGGSRDSRSNDYYYPPPPPPQQQQQGGGHTTTSRGGRSSGGGRSSSSSYYDSRSHKSNKPQLPDDVEVLSELKGHKKKVTCLALDQTSGQLFSGSHDGTVRVWSCISGECISTVQVGGEVDCMLIEAGFLFVGVKTTANLGNINAWNMSTNQQSILEGHIGRIQALTAGNGMLFSGGQDQTIKVWKLNPTTGVFECAATLTAQHGGHAASLSSLCASGPILFSGDVDGTIRCWDMTAGVVKQAIDKAHSGSSHPAIMAMLVWEGHLITGGLDGKIQIWEPADPATHAVLSVSPIYIFPETPTTTTTTSTGSGRGSTSSSRHSYHSSSKGREPVLPGILALAGVADPQGKAVLMASYNGERAIKLWELPTFIERGVLGDVNNARGMVGFAPGKLMMSGDEYGKVKVWRWKGDTSSGTVGGTVDGI